MRSQTEHKNTNKPPRTKPRKRNVPNSLRQWKLDKCSSWNLIQKLAKLFLVTAIMLQIVGNLHSEETNRKLYNLTHNKITLNQRGSAFPIKDDTMLTNQNKIRAKIKHENRMRREFKNRLWESLEHILNLRLLPQKVKHTTTAVIEAWRFMIKHINIPTPNNKAQGPRTFCPICSIPVVGIVGYFKQNFRNMTEVSKMTAKNFN